METEMEPKTDKIRNESMRQNGRKKKANRARSGMLPNVPLTLNLLIGYLLFKKKKRKRKEGCPHKILTRLWAPSGLERL